MVKIGATVKEVPIVFLEREIGTSKISKKDQFESFYVVTRLGLYPYKRFIKFLVVGGTGFFMQFLTVYVSILIGAEQFIAAMIGGEIAILSNFILNNLWTFGDTKAIKQQGSFFRRLVKFNVASLGSIGIQGVVVYFAVHALGEQLQLLGFTVPTSMVILVPTIILIVIPLNYFIYNKVIWKTQYLQHSNNKGGHKPVEHSHPTEAI
jgi:putative flippase GtrA